MKLSDLMFGMPMGMHPIADREPQGVIPPPLTHTPYDVLSQDIRTICEKSAAAGVVIPNVGGMAARGNAA